MDWKKWPHWIREGIMGGVIAGIFPLIPYFMRWAFSNMIAKKGSFYIFMYVYSVIAMLPLFYTGLIQFHKVIYISLLRFCESSNTSILFNSATCPIGFIFSLFLLSVIWMPIGFIIGAITGITIKKIKSKFRQLKR